ncbi:MAG TPA: SOS response-associated peptidase family protein [Rhodoglobus sp.]|nr:SOS response-associated peptidase family protein [Rhodoglobus sp.]
MSTRLVVALPAGELVAPFEVDHVGDGLPAPSYAVSPGDRVPVLLDAIPRDPDAGGAPLRRLESARWGLAPASPGAAPVTTVPIERAGGAARTAEAVARRRAVLPVTGYVERSATEGPQYVHAPGDELVVLAGLYEWWRDPARSADDPARWVLTATVLTQPATDPLTGIRERMPVFIDPAFADEWLDPHEQDADELLEAIAAAAPEQARRMAFHAIVDPPAGAPRDSPVLIAPVGG